MKSKVQTPEMNFIAIQIGYACFIAAVSRALRSVDSLFLGSSLSSLESILLPNILFFASLLLIGLVGVRYRYDGLERRMGIVGNVTLITGFCLVAISTCTSNAFLVYASGFFFGIGGALGFIAWVQLFATEGDRAKYELVSSALFSSIIALAMGAITEVLHIVAICFVLLTISTISFWFACYGDCSCPADKTKGPKASACANDGMLLKALRCVWRPAFCVGVIGFITSASRFLLAEYMPNSIIEITMLGSIAGCLVILVVLYVEIDHPSVSISSIYKVLFPANAIMFLFLIFFNVWYQALQTGFSELSFQICAIIMIQQSIEYGKALGIRSSALYGLYSGMAHFILFLGYPLAFYARGFIDYAVYVVVAIVIYLISVSTTLYAKEQKWDSALFEPSDRDATAFPTQGAAPEKSPLVFNAPVNEELIALLESAIKSEDATETIVERYNLSKREAEIFDLILTGRNVPFIADVLYLSKNTVRTHIKNIYAKLDVHSRQELINLVHPADDDDAE